MENIVEIKNFSKKYGNKKVIEDVSFSIPSGQIVGLFGINGSGKTTILKSIVGLCNNYDGSILIDGKNIGVYTKSIVSYLPEKTYFNGDITGKKAILIFRDFYKDFNSDKAQDMLKNLSIPMDQRISTMSKGMQEKLQLVMVMSRKAKLYVLDEPLGGVDPISRDYILDIILKNYNENSSIILTTHIISDIEKIFDRALFIKDGKLTIDEYVDVIREEKNKSINEFFREVYL